MTRIIDMYGHGMLMFFMWFPSFLINILTSKYYVRTDDEYTNTLSGLPLVREKSGKFKVREKSGNFVIGQGNLEF